MNMNASLRRIVSAYTGALEKANRTAVLSERAIDVWNDRLSKLARDLDLSFANDRFTFRRKVEQATKSSRVELIAELARHFGREPTSDSREDVTFALARAWEQNSEA